MAQQTLNVITQQSAIFNSLTPPEGPKAVSLVLDFGAATSYLLDFTQAYEQTVMTVVQTLWVDNSNNSDEVKFSVAGSNQCIICPAYSQGSFPVISAIRAKITAVTSTTALVKIVALNVPLPSATWAVDGDVIPTAADAFEVVTGGTSVIAFAAGSVPNGAIISNPNAATIYVDIVNAAQDAAPGSNGTTTALTTGMSFKIPPGCRTAVTVNCASSATSFTAYRL
jgi:hypothetical protein